MSGLRKGTFESYLFFLLSPLLSLPLIGIQIKRKDPNVILLISFFLGLISYLYIPNVLDDKAKYFERYNLFMNFSLDDFFNHLIVTQRPDFIFESLLYIFARFGFNIHYLFLFITSFTTYIIFKFIKRNSVDDVNYSYLILLTILTFSSISIFSGIRFYLAFAFFLISIEYLLNENNKSKFYYLFFLLLAVQTHFSFIIFIVTFLIIKKKYFPLLRKLFIISFVFILLPKSFFESIGNVFSFASSYTNKLSTYVEDDIFEFTENGILLDKLKNLWSYLALLFLLFYKPRFRDSIYSLLIFNGIILNLVSSLMLVYGRYSIIFKVFFVIFMIKENLQYKILGKIMFILLFISFSLEIFVLRDSFFLVIDSFGLTIVTILNNDFGISDFLKF